MPSIPHSIQLAFDFNDPLKTCTKCRKALSSTSFYIRDKRTGWLFSRCKACHNATAMGYYNARVGRVGDVDRRTLRRPIQTEKCCTRCGMVKARDAFQIRSDHARLRSWCNACRALEKRDYTERNAEKIRAGTRAYRQCRRVVLSERQREWRLTHPVDSSAIAKRSRAKYQDRVTTYNHEWRRANRALCNTYWSKRRARLLGNGGSHTVVEWQAILERYDHRCLACGRTDLKLTKDHVLPVTQGGTDNADNLQPLCLSCNAAKGKRTIDYRPR
jgi:5-methylcytosine-specific restriction endonuclease McrA